MCVDPDPESRPRSGRRSRRIHEAVQGLRPVELDRETHAALEGNTAQDRKGGLIVQRSACCDAPITVTQGGLHREICSRCERPAEEPRLKKA